MRRDAGFLTADLSRLRLAPTFVCYFVGKRLLLCLAADFILRFFVPEEGGGGYGLLPLSKAASSFT